MARPHKLTDDDWTKIKARRDKGDTYPELAKAFRVSTATIYNFVKRHAPLDKVESRPPFKPTLVSEKPEAPIERPETPILGGPVTADDLRLSGGAAYVVPESIINRLHQYETMDATRVLLRCLTAMLETDTPPHVLETCADQLIYVATFVKMRLKNDAEKAQAKNS